MPDEVDEASDRAFAVLQAEEAIVPALWRFEIANALVIASRRRRLSAEGLRSALLLLDSLPVAVDAQPDVGLIVERADQYGLTAYDAAYLELAVRSNARLATLDRRLQDAARQRGVALV